VTGEATTRRAELRRQKWQIRRRELELMASKNYLLPRLDGVGRYRWRGFGDDLFPIGPVPPPPDDQFDGAYSNLTSGNFQEWQLGFELSVPIGFRQAHVAARNAELLLARERAILRDQQREIVHEAADAVAEMDRAYVVMQTSYNRLIATKDQNSSVKATYEEGKGEVPLDLYLESQRRLVEAETEYFLNRARYSLATKNVHFVKGTLLEYDGIYLAEGPWPGKAYHDAADKEASRSVPVPLNYASSKAPVVSQGPFGQHTYDAAVDPFSGEHLHMAPPMHDAPATEPDLLQPGEEILPPPTGEETPPPVSASKSPAAELSQPTFIQGPGGKSGSSSIVVSSGHGDIAGGVVPAIHLGSKSNPAAAAKPVAAPSQPVAAATATPAAVSVAATPTSASPTTRRLPPAITR
jgi:hypothetical protein